MLEKRCYFIYELPDPIKEIYLLGFFYASQSAYAAYICFKSVTQSGNVKVKFAFAKSRVIPIKKSFSIRRLQWLGNYILSKLTCNVYTSICDDTVNDRVSVPAELAALARISAPLKLFVSNKRPGLISRPCSNKCPCP